MIDLRCGRWQDVLGDVECDHLISDPPYGARTHEGQRHGRREAGDYKSGNWCTTDGIPYTGWTADDVREFVDSFAPRTRGWFCAFTSHDLIPHYTEALEQARRYVFAPIACVIRGMNVRLAGDGPSNWTVWLIASRPRSGAKWGTLPGAYVGDREDQCVIGGKPLWLMRSVVRDYSRLGDTIVDPCGGGFTTALAAAIEGRNCISSEMDPETFAKGQARIARGYTPATLFAERAEPEQSALDLGEP